MKTLTLFLLLASVALFSGCTTTNTVERADPVGQRTYIDDVRVITDRSLNEIRLLGINTTTVSGDIMKIQAEFYNTSSRPRNFSSRCTWFDLDGMVVRTPTNAFKSHRIMGKQTISVTYVAVSPRAKDFRLELLEPQN